MNSGDYAHRTPKPNPNPTPDPIPNEGTDVNSGDYDHRTPLHLAASEGLLPVVS